ncbi:hypothetical protein K2X33_06045 [bacterium]|nr:hypothetical protein [bacterium]
MVLKSAKVLALGLALYTANAFAGAWITGAYKQWSYRVFAENTYANIYFSDGVTIQLPKNNRALEKCNNFDCYIYEAGPRKLVVHFDQQTGRLRSSRYSYYGQ